MSCYCDYDGPEFLSIDTRKARTQHKCCECGHVIEPGEKYEHVAGKWDGWLGTFDTCGMCAELREAVADYNGGCYQYGGLDEAYWAYLEELPPRDGLDTHALHAGVFAKHRMGHNAPAQAPAKAAHDAGN